MSEAPETPRRAPEGGGGAAPRDAPMTRPAVTTVTPSRGGAVGPRAPAGTPKPAARGVAVLYVLVAVCLFAAWTALALVSRGEGLPPRGDPTDAGASDATLRDLYSNATALHGGGGSGSSPPDSLEWVEPNPSERDADNETDATPIDDLDPGDPAPEDPALPSTAAPPLAAPSTTAAPTAAATVAAAAAPARGSPPPPRSVGPAVGAAPAPADGTAPGATPALPPQRPTNASADAPPAPPAWVVGGVRPSDRPGAAAARARGLAALLPEGFVEGPEPRDDAAERAAPEYYDHPAAAGVGLRVDLQVLRDFRPWRKHGISADDLARTRAHRAQLIERVGNVSSGMVTTIILRGVPYLLESEVSGPLEREYGIGSKGKVRGFMEMLTAVGRAYPLPDAHFIWNVHPWPLLRASETRRKDLPAPRGLAPVLSLCKTAHDLDVLYPNMYFQSPRYWWRATRSLERASGNWAWARRRDKMWWRGASGWMWPAAAPRVLTLARWHAKPWADFAFTNPWKAQLREWERAKVPWRRTLPREVARIPNGPHARTSMEAVAKYKYALHLPGSYGATYSRTLQFLVWTGTTIFLYDCPYFEFYYHHLQPYVHYVPVNLTSLGDRVAWAHHHPTKAAAIAAAAQRFAATQLTAGHVTLYWGQLLEEYASLQRFVVKLPDDACTCWPVRPGSSALASRPSSLPRGTRRCKWICDYRSP